MMLVLLVGWRRVWRPNVGIRRMRTLVSERLRVVEMESIGFLSTVELPVMCVVELVLVLVLRVVRSGMFNWVEWMVALRVRLRRWSRRGR
jgi:hypothetical protein